MRAAKMMKDSPNSPRIQRGNFLGDTNCPLAYEPSGEDFLSPCLGEADVMRRVLSQEEFAKWLKDFLPQIPATHGEAATANWLPVTVSPDPSEPKIAHLDGLKLSFAGRLEGIALALTPANFHRPQLPIPPYVLSTP